MLESDTEYREPPKDPRLLLPFSKAIVLESGYVAPANLQNDPSRAPIRTKWPEKGFASRA